MTDREPPDTPETPRGEPSSSTPVVHRTILESIAGLVGEVSKVLLPDSDSQHGASPIVTPQTTSGLVPQGRANYQLMGEIARGGMGSILKGHDTDLGRDVAIKVLREEIAGNSTAVQRFVEEAQIGGQLQHPGIVPVYELGLMADDRPYFTMKLVKGRTLAELLHERKSLTEGRGRFLAIFEAVCQTVAYAHSKKVLHRDLKPANIMVGAFGEVQVVDWGLAKVLQRGGVADEERAREDRMSVVETVRSGPGSYGSDSLAGSVMGTPAYMAPEQAQGEIDKLDERADVFSLGAILCELLTGEPPYLEGEERALVQAARAHLDPCRARLERCDADAELVQLCLDCLTPARDARPRNADEVAHRIQAYLASVEDRAHRAEVEAAEQRRARTLTTAVAGLVVLVVVFGGGSFYLVEKERAAHVDFVRTSIDSLHNEAIGFGQVGKLAEAVSVAERAVSLAAEDEGAADLLPRTERFLSQTRTSLQAAERERALAEQDSLLIQDLEALRLEQAEAALSSNAARAELDRRFVAAFAEYGADLTVDDLVPALDRIRERGISEEVALALDDWTALRQALYEREPDKAERLIHLAIDLDRDTLRTRMRLAILNDDIDTLLALVRPEDLHRLTPGSIWAISAYVWNRHPEHRPDVYLSYDRGLRLYPGDFILQAMGGFIYTSNRRRSEGVGCYSAAVGLRPDNAFVRDRLGRVLADLGEVPRAIGTFDVSIELDPANPDSHFRRALCYYYLGQYEPAIAGYEDYLALADSQGVRAEILLNRFYLGQAPVEEVLAMNDEFGQAVMSVGAPLCWGLVDHPDAAQHRAEVAYEFSSMGMRMGPAEEDPFPFTVHAAACYAVGEYEECLENCDRMLGQGPLSEVDTMSCVPFLRAMSLHALGREREGLAAFHQAAPAVERRLAEDAEVWSASSPVRWLRRAEAALGL